MITIVLEDMKLKSLNELIRMQKFARHTYNEKVRKAVQTAALIQGIPDITPPKTRQKVTITIQHKKSYDRDGRYGASKPVLDAIVARPAQARIGKTKFKVMGCHGPILRWGLILDDSEKYIDLEVKEVIAKTYKVTIEVDNA